MLIICALLKNLLSIYSFTPFDNWNSIQGGNNKSKQKETHEKIQDWNYEDMLVESNYSFLNAGFLFSKFSTWNKSLCWFCWRFASLSIFCLVIGKSEWLVKSFDYITHKKSSKKTNRITSYLQMILCNMQSRDGNYALCNNIYHWKGLLSLYLTNICYVSFIYFFIYFW